MRPIARLLLLLPLAGVGACSDNNGLPNATLENMVDTVTIGSLVGTPISTPSGFFIDGSGVGAVRTDASVNFEFAYNIEPGGRRVFLPRAALGLSSTTANPGVQLRPETFDEITKARSNGYVTDSAVAVELGQRFLVRSRVICTTLGVPLYAKLEILGFADSTVTFRVLADRNCGYKGLEPGLPSE
jgi:hypothetical protein